MTCGMDCPNFIYVSWGNVIYKVGSTAATPILTSPGQINCMGSSLSLNTLLYRTGSSVLQLSLGANGNNLAYSLMDKLPSTEYCSVDISDSNAMIMLVENGVVRVIETLQKPCPDWQTSEAVTSTSPSSCYPCPVAPENGHLLPGSSTCAWQCLVGFVLLGSQCVSQPNPPCPKYFYEDGGACFHQGCPGRRADHTGPALARARSWRPSRHTPTWAGMSLAPGW